MIRERCVGTCSVMCGCIYVMCEYMYFNEFLQRTCHRVETSLHSIFAYISALVVFTKQHIFITAYLHCGASSSIAFIVTRVYPWKFHGLVNLLCIASGVNSPWIKCIASLPSLPLSL